MDTPQPVGLGLLVGLVAAFWGARLVEALLIGIDGRDPWTAATVIVCLVATALAAAWIPARRAARTNPTLLLRAD